MQEQRTALAVLRTDAGTQQPELMSTQRNENTQGDHEFRTRASPALTDKWTGDKCSVMAGLGPHTVTSGQKHTYMNQLYKYSILETETRKVLGRSIKMVKSCRTGAVYYFIGAGMSWVRVRVGLGLGSRLWLGCR